MAYPSINYDDSDHLFIQLTFSEKKGVYESHSHPLTIKKDLTLDS
jgi:hypothetical protein